MLHINQQPREQTIFGWLFVLEASQADHLSRGNVTIRPMEPEERNRILRSSTDFFAHDLRFWNRNLERFPLVFEKKVIGLPSIGSRDSVGVVLSLLAPGEVRTPIVWSLYEGGGAGASDAQVIDCFYRLMNGRFQTIALDSIRQSIIVSFEKLRNFISSLPHECIDMVLLERLYESKEQTLCETAPTAQIIARAADICIGLESLYAEGPGEVQFKLAISIAWLLEQDPAKREAAMKAVRETYALRSKIIHGGKGSYKPLEKSVMADVMLSDRLFRRSVLMQLLNQINTDQWKEAFKKARLGFPIPLDPADWVQM